MDGKISRRNLVVGDWPGAKFVSQLLFKAEGYVAEENTNSLDEVHVMVNVGHDGKATTQIRASSDNDEYDGTGELWLSWKESGVFEVEEGGDMTGNHSEPFWCDGSANHVHEPRQVLTTLERPKCPRCGRMMTYGNYYKEPNAIATEECEMEEDNLFGLLDACAKISPEVWAEDYRGP